MKDNKNTLAQYGSLGMQLVVGLTLCVYGGLWLDKKIAIKTPIFIWLLPLILIISMIVKVIKETTNNS
jgi:uncharacterized membrane protein